MGYFFFLGSTEHDQILWSNEKKKNHSFDFILSSVSPAATNSNLSFKSQKECEKSPKKMMMKTNQIQQSTQDRK